MTLDNSSTILRWCVSTSVARGPRVGGVDGSTFFSTSDVSWLLYEGSVTLISPTLRKRLSSFISGYSKISYGALNFIHPDSEIVTANLDTDNYSILQKRTPSQR